MAPEEPLVEVEPLTNRPVDLWRKMQYFEGRIAKSVSQMRLNTPIFADKVRFVCISDTHEKLDEIVARIPAGDVLVHAGDFTQNGDLGAVVSFNSTIGSLPHKHKIVIAGNHEVGFEEGDKLTEGRIAGLKMLEIRHPTELLTNCTYLCDREVEVYGLKIYGSPWHPLPGWSFYRCRGQQLLNKWNQIPRNTDVLITHTPPLGHGDYSQWKIYDEMLSGCAELLNTIEKRVRPKYHIFGHIHERHGMSSNNQTVFINASICDRNYRCAFNPIIFDLPLPHGFSKD